LAALLVEKGADPNVENPGGNALHVALQVRNPDWERIPDPLPTGNLDSLGFIKVLLAHGVNPNARATKRLQNMGGVTPFLLAAYGGDTATMRELVANGANPLMASNENTTPLMVAAGLRFAEGRSPGSEDQALEAVKLALEFGADVNAQNDAGDTALHGAASRGADRIVRFLVENGAKPDVKNKKGVMPVTLAESVAEGKTAHPGTAALLHQLIEGAPTKR
jgi:ankyrin repeat protein